MGRARPKTYRPKSNTCKYGHDKGLTGRCRICENARTMERYYAKKTEHAWCECGNRRLKSQICCENCALLDGVDLASGRFTAIVELYNLLRDHGAMTCEAICNETGLSEWTVYTYVSRLKKRGKIVMLPEVYSSEDGRYKVAYAIAGRIKPEHGLLELEG